LNSILIAREKAAMMAREKTAMMAREKAAMMAREKATAMKSFKLAQVKLDLEVRDKGKAIAAKKEETAALSALGNQGAICFWHFQHQITMNRSGVRMTASGSCDRPLVWGRI